MDIFGRLKHMENNAFSDEKILFADCILEVCFMRCNLIVNVVLAEQMWPYMHVGHFKESFLQRLLHIVFTLLIQVSKILKILQFCIM